MADNASKLAELAEKIKVLKDAQAEIIQSITTFKNNLESFMTGHVITDEKGFEELNNSIQTGYDLLW